MLSRSPAWAGIFSLVLLAAWSMSAQAADKPKAKKKGSAPAATSAHAPPPIETDSFVGPPQVAASAPPVDPAASTEGPADRKVDFSGVWTWTFTNPNNGFVHEPTLKIRQQGSKIAGTIYGKLGGSLPVRDVRITKDSSVAFTLDREFYGYPMEVKFIGKLQRDTIAGKMGVFVNGSSRVFPWTANRVRDRSRDPADPSGKPESMPTSLPRL